MPVCSYLVFPQPGRLQEIAEQLDTFAECTTEKAQEGELLILLTDTDSEGEEQVLQQQLKDIDGIQCLVLTFGALEEVAQ